MENLHQQIYDKLDFFYRNNQIPHIIFHGSSGSGKKTIVYKFLDKIYDGNRSKMKHNIMFVNCSHGKGIKFIREDLKFFAKTNLQMNQGVRFKSIVLFNADSLTTDAQSALRRCIELFSYNTRFFIIVENKHKLLNPILSRFCEIYVPEYIKPLKITNGTPEVFPFSSSRVITTEDEMGHSPISNLRWFNPNGCIENLHTYHLTTKFCMDSLNREKADFLNEKIESIIKHVDQKNIHPMLSDISVDIYEHGYSAIDLIDAICSHETQWTREQKSQFRMKFHSIKSEFRCEKLLILYMLDHIFIDASHET